MKIQNLLIILLAAGLIFVSYKWAAATSEQIATSEAGTDTPDAATSATTPHDASTGATQKSGEFTVLDVTQYWPENPFTWFKGTGLLLAAGDRESNNAMTIGWGSLGNVWGQIGNATVTVYVAEARYTFGFMEKYDYFTVMAFGPEYDGVLHYMGTHSGRDGDKAAALGLHTLYTEHGTPYYAEASLVLECETIYRAPFERKGMSESVRKFYDNFPAGVHHIYIGNIISALIK